MPKYVWRMRLTGIGVFGVILFLGSPIITGLIYANLIEELSGRSVYYSGSSVTTYYFGIAAFSMSGLVGAIMILIGREFYATEALNSMQPQASITTGAPRASARTGIEIDESQISQGTVTPAKNRIYEKDILRYGQRISVFSDGSVDIIVQGETHTFRNLDELLSLHGVPRS